jgi:hypothetical protein
MAFVVSRRERMMMQVGDVMECILLDKDANKTEEFIPVTVCQVKRHWKTGEPESVRVKTKRGRKETWIWVQAEMLRPIQQVDPPPSAE